MGMQQAAGADKVWDVIVVGGGISGLVTAHRLKRMNLQVQVLDTGNRAGGVIGSVAQAGCLYERGPNSAMDTTPLIGEMVQALGLQPRWRLASEVANTRYVVRGGSLLPLPTSPAAFFSTPLFSTAAKLALLREPFVARGAAGVEESIAAFVRRRLGREFLDYAIDPFVAGIYAGDPEQISVPAAFPKLHALEQRWGSLIRGQIFGAAERRKQKEQAKNTAKSFAFDGGMQVLTDALAADVGAVALRTRVLGLTRDVQGLFTLYGQREGEPCSWRCRALVLATPADAAAVLLREHAPDAAAALDEMAYAPVATVATVYRRDDVAHALDGFGCLVPRKEGRRVLGVLFSSSMFEGRAAAGSVLLTSFVGGLRQPQLAGLSEAEIGTLVIAEHRALLGTRQAPLFQQVTRWPRAIPQYTLGHLGRVARAEAAQQALPGLFFCANWKGGVAVGDCIKNGHLSADAVAAHLAVGRVGGGAPASAPRDRAEGMAARL